jgi:hypothetical protein
MPVFGLELGQLGLRSEAAIIIPITRTDTIGTTTVPSINRTIAIIMGRHTTGITGIEFITATTIIITITIKLTCALRLGDWLGGDVEPALFCQANGPVFMGFCPYCAG